MEWGLISKIDSEGLMKTIDLIQDINVEIVEVGLYGGSTGKSLKQYAESKGKKCFITGIDNNKDGEPLRFQYDKFISGNSTEVYNQIPDSSQHLVFIDALHTFPAVVADFFCYAPKVKVGGFLAFHDTGKHINPLHDWQGVGDKNDPDMCLGGVRKALTAMGLFPGNSEGRTIDFRYDFRNADSDNWELIYDEADPNDTAGGICCFRRIY